MAEKRTSSTRGGTVSVADVARHARVSLGTVSRVLNRHPAVAQDLRHHVLISSRKLGFVPHQQRRTIAIVTGRQSPAMPVGYVSVLSSLLTRMLMDRQYVVELIDIENLHLVCEAHIEAAIGVVFDERFAELAKLPNLHLATINRPLAQHGIHSFYADHYQQALLATNHLLDAGHRRIGFLAIEPDEWGSRERLRGYTDALAARSIRPLDAWIRYTSQGAVYDILSRWRQNEMTGLLNFSEDTSLEVLHILANVLQLRIGRDVSTVSLEDLPVYQYLTPPQTVVRQPLQELARLAVDTLIACCEGRQGGTIADTKLATELVARDSVARINVQTP